MPPRFLWLVGLALPVATGIALGILTYDLAVESGGESPNDGEGSGRCVDPLGTPFDCDNPPMPLPPPVVAPDQDDPEHEADTAAIAEDNKRPRFRGAIGDFLIAGMGTLKARDVYPCPNPLREIGRSQADGSELAFDSPKVAPLERSTPAVGCGDVVVGISGDAVLPDDPTISVYVSRFYFVSQKLPLPLDAPFERLVLTDVDGLAALMEIPPDDDPWCRLFVIERHPSGGTPGVGFEVTGALSCERAQAFAADFFSREALGE